MTKMTPIESEFATSEEADAHDAWFRAKVGVALHSAEASLPHDSVMTEARHEIDKRRSAADRLAR